MAKKIDLDILEHFKYMQDVHNALTYLAHIVYEELPTDNNYPGRMAFALNDERLYIYTSAGWKKLPWLEEASGGWAKDSNGNIYPSI